MLCAALLYLSGHFILKADGAFDIKQISLQTISIIQLSSKVVTLIEDNRMRRFFVLMDVILSQAFVGFLGKQLREERNSHLLFR